MLLETNFRITAQCEVTVTVRFPIEIDLRSDKKSHVKPAARALLLRGEYHKHADISATFIDHQSIVVLGIDEPSPEFKRELAEALEEKLEYDGLKCKILKLGEVEDE